MKNINDMSDEINRTIQMIIPYLMVGKDIDYKVMGIIIVPYISIIIKFIVDYVKKILKNDKKIKIIELQHVKSATATQYDAIIAYILDHTDDINEYVCVGKSEPRYSWRNRPKFPNLYGTNIYDLPDNCNVEIKFMSENIYIERSSIQEEKRIRKIVRIKSHKSTDLIEKFIQNACDEYIEKNDNDKPERKFYRWNITKDGNGWEGKNIVLNKTVDNIFYNGTIKEDIIECMDKFVKSEEEYNEYGQCYKKGIVLRGKPGCGKTGLTFALSKKYNYSIYCLDLNVISDPSKLRRATEYIPPRSIILCDDFDTHKSTHSRKNKKELEDKCGNTDDLVDLIACSEYASKDKNAMLGALLEAFDGYNSLYGCIVILTTNHFDHLDPALVRPGRFDNHYDIDIPDTHTICKIISYFYKMDMNELEPIFEGYVNEDIATAMIINTYIVPNMSDHNAGIYGILENLKCVPTSSNDDIIDDIIDTNECMTS
jgi:SpoVK/Ycf46/Vps4 family AAA+-type ATPase